MAPRFATLLLWAAGAALGATGARSDCVGCKQSEKDCVSGSERACSARPAESREPETPDKNSDEMPTSLSESEPDSANPPERTQRDFN